MNDSFARGQDVSNLCLSDETAKSKISSYKNMENLQFCSNTEGSVVSRIDIDTFLI